MVNAKALWESLERKYKTEDAGSKKFVVGKFLDFKMVDSKTVISQVQEFQLILHDIHAEGMVLGESFQVAALIEKLPPTWKDFKNYLKHKRKEMKLEDLIVRLRIEEDNRQSEKKAGNYHQEAKANVVEQVINDGGDHGETRGQRRRYPVPLRRSIVEHTRKTSGKTPWPAHVRFQTMAGPHFPSRFREVTPVPVDQKPKATYSEASNPDRRNLILLGTVTSISSYVCQDVSNEDVCGTVYTEGITGRHYSGFYMFPSTNLVCYSYYGIEYVCNLATKEVSSLPDSSSPHGRGMACGYILATNEYKILSFIDRDTDADYTDGYKHGCEILTLRDGGPVPDSWREVEDLPQLAGEMCGNSAQVNGSMYMIFSEEKKILSFELENEKFKSLSYPQNGYTPHCEGNKENRILAELEGFLCLGYYWKQFSAMTILMLVDLESEIWDKKYSIPLYEIGKEIRIRGLGYLPLSNENGEILIQLFGRRAVLYNINDKSFRRVGDASLVFDEHNAAQFDLYFERFFTLGEQVLD
ncbi:hypothetical protein RJ639_031257 [Escallonia herrerae]|uniref:F-box associated beta-propeller type 3 domain-containing protein n=1 Tax=Escallonia herrerae TaxID=1293975 RepID=A0AA89BC02_9ASTE|nr:hypothetical protein RJ639_031257 [Escallonia herrerae]